MELESWYDRHADRYRIAIWKGDQVVKHLEFESVYDMQVQLSQLNRLYPDAAVLCSDLV